MRILIVAITFIWVGLVLGISFIEAPLKFQAPGITLPLGLGIGKIVFGALNKVEIVLSILLVAGFILGKLSIKNHYLYVIIFLVLLVQSIWLLPILDDRADLIISEQRVSETYHHILYIILEVMKVALLSTAGIKFIRLFQKPV